MVAPGRIGRAGFRLHGGLGGPAASKAADVLSRLADDGDVRAAGNDIAFSGQHLEQEAATRRFDLVLDLIGLDVENNLSLFDRFAFALAPLEDGSFFHGEAEFGHREGSGHESCS